MRFTARQFAFTFPRPALVMGIVNVTPDSFSDGGLHATTEQAVAHGLKLIAEGADLLDVGGESTRPGAAPVQDAEEMARVLPVIRELVRHAPETPVSIDTRKPAVAEAALDAGAAIVNDIAANRGDPAMWRLVSRTNAGYIAMHMQGDPQTMQTRPVYDDVVAEVGVFFRQLLQRLADQGMSPECIALDVGIGFGKTLEHNLKLLGALSSFQTLNRPLLLGVSRKSFIGRLTEAAAGDRLPGSLAAAVLAVQQGVQMIRTHDVAATRQALTVAEAILRQP